ncbi:MAG: hypothetical protein ABEK01_05750 [Candidatus Nanohaloarchaea archaeon]
MSFDPEKFVDRNYAGEVDGYRENELYLLVHPGFGLENDEYRELDLRPEDHFRYCHELFSELDRMFDSDAEIAVLEEMDSGYSREFLGDYAGEVDHWFETLRGSAKIRYRDADGFIDLVRSLEDGSTVTISGEHNNLCEGQARQLVDYIADFDGTDLRLRKGVVFPDRPLERDEWKNLEYS